MGKNLLRGLPPIAVDRQAGVALLTSMCFLFLAGAFAWGHVTVPFDGLIFPHGAAPWSADGIAVAALAGGADGFRPGDVLLVLEAMKMETNITAPGPGKIAGITVKEGESVQSGQVVVELE